MLNSRGGGMHHSLLSPGTGDCTLFTCIKSECPAQARMGRFHCIMQSALETPNSKAFTAFVNAHLKMF